MNCDNFPILLNRLISHHKGYILLNLLQPAGFDLEIIEEFSHVFFELLESLFSYNNDKNTALVILISSLNEGFLLSNSIVAYLRLVSSAWIRLNSDSVIPCTVFNFFLRIDIIRDDSDTLLPVNIVINSYCSRIVEPMDQPSDDISILALVNAFSTLPLSITCKIVSMDTAEDYLPEFSYSSSSKDGNGGENGVFFSFLFRPGHYDLLYK